MIYLICLFFGFLFIESVLSQPLLRSSPTELRETLDKMRATEKEKVISSEAHAYFTSDDYLIPQLICNKDMSDIREFFANREVNIILQPAPSSLQKPGEPLLLNGPTTPLILSILCKRQDVFELLLSLNASPNLSVEELLGVKFRGSFRRGHSPLIAAVLIQNHEFLQRVLQVADPNLSVAETSAVGVAIDLHDIEALGILKTKNASLDAYDIDWKNALHTGLSYAIALSKLDVAKELRALGAKLNPICPLDVRFADPLTAAIENDQIALATEFVRQGANIDGCTPRDIGLGSPLGELWIPASYPEKHPGADVLFDLLLTKGAAQYTSFHKPILFRIVDLGEPEFVLKFLNHPKVQLDVRDKDNRDIFDLFVSFELGFAMTNLWPNGRGKECLLSQWGKVIVRRGKHPRSSTAERRQVFQKDSRYMDEPQVACAAQTLNIR